MLRIYSVAVEMCRDAGVSARAIERSDPDLARQLRKAATSVVLNIAEGSGSFGGNRKQRYHSALGSAREVVAVYDSAEAMRYIDRVAPAVRARLDEIIGTTVNVLRLRR
jgi:four helix bundle protein